MALYAPKSKLFSWFFVAFLYIFFTLSGCESCTFKSSAKNTELDIFMHEGTSSELPENNDLNKYLPDACRDNHNKDFPAIYAHYLAQSFPHDTQLQDILANDIGMLECAPGPFLFERGNEIDSLEKRWKLKGTPNYFVLHLESNKITDESFYIANQNGFPLRCQYYKLQQDGSSTLVLLPKVDMEPGQVYFLYLILNENNARRTWIQPLVTTKERKGASAGA